MHYHLTTFLSTQALNGPKHDMRGAKLIVRIEQLGVEGFACALTWVTHRFLYYGKQNQLQFALLFPLSLSGLRVRDEKLFHPVLLLNPLMTPNLPYQDL